MEILSTIVIVLVLAAFIFAAVAVILFLIGIMQSSTVPFSKSNSEMDEGELHSGPAGYSPNTAYPDTFYGSGGDLDGHDEGDFNR